MMRILILLFGAFALISTPLSAAEFRFAAPETAQKILTAEDVYLANLSPAEISIRLNDPDTIALNALKETYRKGVMVWSDAERRKLNDVLAKNREKLEKLAPLLPETVYFIKVSAKVEGGLPHTRANAIVYPIGSLSAPAAQFESLFFHELFHVLSRQQHDRHDSLFALIGFAPCSFEEPASLLPRRLSNPDAPTYNHYIPVTIAGADSAVIPYLYTSRERFDPELEGGFPGHFGFGLLEVKVTGDTCSTAYQDNGEPNLLNPDQTAGFFEAIGRNTGYIIHPEETLADNFAYLMTGRQDLPNPEIPARLAAWLGIND